MLENLIHSLMAVNENGSLTYLIQDLKGRQISQEAPEALIFTLITLIIYSFPEIIMHPKRHSLEKLYDYCFSIASPQELVALLEKPHNAQIKNLLYDYFKQLPSQKNHLLDQYVQFLMIKNQPAPLLTFLLQDYAQFVANLDKTSPHQATKRD